MKRPERGSFLLRPSLWTGFERKGKGRMDMAGKKDLTGQRFGRLTVMEATGQREAGYRVWLCRCDCGGQIRVDTKRLKNGLVKDCGCVPRKDARRGSTAEDLTGQTFGHLTVLSRVENRNGRTCWLCRCDCGNEKKATARDLKAGKVKSCGCHSRDRAHNRADLTGRTFGRLTALYPLEKRDRKGSVYWKCACQCGGETEATQDALVQGGVRSCGCLKSENQKKIAGKLHRVDGTCVEILKNRKYRRDNTSGFRGVFQTKNGHYRVDIGFKGKRFYLGTYTAYEEAVDVRRQAEEVIYKGFVDAYQKWKETADQDPEWGRAHPLLFDVVKRGGSLYLETEDGDRLLL